MSKNLFDDSDDNLNEDFHIKTNENYAKTYNSLRKKELHLKYKDTGIDVSDSESDGSDDSSLEDGILDSAFDQDFLKTLACLKSKDPAIYDKNIKFFNSVNSCNSGNENGKSNITKEMKSRPVTLKDYERKIILEQGGKFIDDSDVDDNEEENYQRPLSPTPAEEERRLKDEFKKLMTKDESSDEEFGGIFKKREKTKAEKDKDEDDYLNWLAGKKESIEADVKDKLEPLKNYWSNDNLPSSEKFLRDYVLNKGYTNATNYEEIPTYEEIVGDHTPLSEDEQELEKQAEFEEKYNFRFEEPDQEFIKRYPRTIETSLRLTGETRKKKRQEIKERKLQEKQQKLKDMEILKEMKRKEILEKIEKLKIVTGNNELGFEDADLEEDFDPDAHDRRMRELFNDEYYQVDEGEEKPDFPSDIEELKVEDWDNYDPQQATNTYDYEENEPHCEDEDFNMDCEYDPTKTKDNLQRELIENTRKRRSGRKGRQDRFMEMIKSKKPVFDPEDEKTYGEYLEEYYKLDCEDIIGDTPCRFKYVETTPNDFGLTIEEILLAKNKELNQWASLKKSIQIRSDHVEKKEQRLYKLKSKNGELKRKIFKSLYGDGSDNEDLEEEQTKEINILHNTMSNNVENTHVNTVEVEPKKTTKRKKGKTRNIPPGSQAAAVEKPQGLAIETPVKQPKVEKSDHVVLSSNSGQPADRERYLGIKKKKKNNKRKIQIHNQLEDFTTNEKSNILDNKSTAVRNINNKNPFNKDFPKIPTNAVDKKMLHGNKNDHTSNEVKTVAKNNPFAKEPKQSNICARESIGILAPFRKNQSKLKRLNDSSNIKFKSKFQSKKPFNGEFRTNSDSKDISDERLKAYGLNPRKFHRKQKYGNVN